MAVLHRHSPQYLETAQVRSQQQETTSGIDQFQRLLKSINAKIKLFELTGEEKDPIENGGGETVNMACDIPQSGGTAENTAEIVARGAARR